MTPDVHLLTDYLTRSRYLVYPGEISCGRYETPNSPYRLVDVAAYRNGRFYAFEYKSSGDPVSNAVRQVENYGKSFDYVLLVLEVPRKGRYGFSLTLRRGKRIYEIIRCGVGVWSLSKNSIGREYRIQEIVKAKLQRPNHLNRDFIRKTFTQHFKKYNLTKPEYNPQQRQLEQWLKRTR